MINEDKQNLNIGGQNGPWWKPGVKIFSEVSTWIFVPIILALTAGKALDKHYGTGHLFLLVLAGIGFFITSFGIFRTVRKYVKSQKQQSAEEVENNNL